MTIVAAGVDAIWSDAIRVASTVSAQWGQYIQFETKVGATWGQYAQIEGVVQSDYSIKDPFGFSFSMPYGILGEAKVQQLFSVGYSIKSAATESAVVAGLATLTHEGKSLRLHTASISLDEGGSFFIGSVELADIADYARIEFGDPVTLKINGDQFEMLVDAKQGSRTITDQTTTLQLISRAALAAAPHAKSIDISVTVATAASDIVERAIPGIVWNVPDWIVPAYRVDFQQVEPIDVANAFAEAIGGVVEAQPSGELKVRSLYPVDVKDYSTATPDHVFTESEIFSLSESVAPPEVFNRVVLTDGDGAGDGGSGENQLQTEVDQEYLKATINAYPLPFRAVTLEHTGDGSVKITPGGSLTRTETAEIIEITAGTGRTKYPIDAVITAEWRAKPAGQTTISGYTVTVPENGYGLLALTYTTRLHTWQVSNSTVEPVQFLFRE
jgi:hypothetical protein